MRNWRRKRKKPESLDLESARDRAVVLRAYHALLSQGLDEIEARKQAASYALKHWEEVA